MIYYRKSKNVDREFFRIEKDLVTRVELKEKSALVQTADNWVARSMATDEYVTVPSTQEEFEAAHKEALAINTLMRIV